MANLSQITFYNVNPLEYIIYAFYFYNPVDTIGLSEMIDYIIYYDLIADFNKYIAIHNINIVYDVERLILIHRKCLI